MKTKYLTILTLIPIWYVLGVFVTWDWAWVQMASPPIRAWVVIWVATSAFTVILFFEK